MAEKSLLFKDGKKTTDIPYSRICSLDVQGKAERVGPMPALPSFTKIKTRTMALATASAVPVLAIIESFLCSAVDWPRAAAVLTDSGDGTEMVTFGLAGRDFVRLYPLLVEKLGL